MTVVRTRFMGSSIGRCDDFRPRLVVAFASLAELVLFVGVGVRVLLCGARKTTKTQKQKYLMNHEVSL